MAGATDQGPGAGMPPGDPGWPPYEGEMLMRGGDVGAERAEALLEEVPAGDRLYHLGEIINMMGALGALPENDDEWRSWCEGNVEHMAAGGYVVGEPGGGVSVAAYRSVSQALLHMHEAVLADLAELVRKHPALAGDVGAIVKRTSAALAQLRGGG